VIVLDANVVLIDFRYRNDPTFAVNRRALNEAKARGVARTVPSQVVLEIVGVLSFGTRAEDVPKLWPTIQAGYELSVFPDPAVVHEHCGCTPDEVFAQMLHKMAAGDAVIAAQVAKFAPGATAFLTWNLKHFRGHLAIPVLTPEEWLQQQQPAVSTPPTGPTP